MNTKQITVLLVDDDVDFLEVNRTALEAAGYRVLTASDGEQGMKLACENPVSVAVLDVMMSTPDEGFQLARELRSDERTRRIPLLMLTSVNAENRARGLATFSDADRDDAYLPVDRFVEKPVRPDRLVDLVAQVLA